MREAHQRRAGDVPFRGAIHTGRHEAIIDRETFAACNALLEQRGESQRLKATLSSGYDFAGLMTCEKCSKRMLGAGANGRTRRYR